MNALALRLGQAPDDVELLHQAMAHRSWCAENADEPSNERLEFLGDAVLGLIVTDHIFDAYPDLPEGELAKVRASVVNAEVLADLAVSLDLGSALLLGKGEDASGGREKPSILADAFEAVIGAIYLELGWTRTADLVMDLLGERIKDAAAGPGGQDYKTRLQELAAQQAGPLPRYMIEEEGPDHAKRFRASVHVAGRLRGRGEGRSKKQAEQAAARMAWADLSGSQRPAADQADQPDQVEAMSAGSAEGGVADPSGGVESGERA